jgi:hypothetical protein
VKETEEKNYSFDCIAVDSGSLDLVIRLAHFSPEGAEILKSMLKPKNPEFHH